MNKLKIHQFLFTFKDSKIIFYFIALISTFFLLGLIDYRLGSYKDESFWGNVLVEAHGMLMDIFLLGLIVTIFEVLRADKEKIERYKEEIDDYRGWIEAEAMHRILGNIKRLNRLGVSKIDLHACNLQGAYYASANLEEARMWHIVMNNAIFWYANLKKASLFKAQLKGADLKGANLTSAFLVEANFEGAKLEGVTLDNAIVSEVDWIEKLASLSVKGIEEIKEKYFIDPKGFDNIKLDDKVVVYKCYFLKRKN